MDDASGYPDYKLKLLRWSRITKIAKNKQAEYVVYHLDEHPSRIQEKIDTAVGAEIEDKDDGMDKLIAFLDDIYAEDEILYFYKNFVMTQIEGPISLWENFRKNYCRVLLSYSYFVVRAF